VLLHAFSLEFTHPFTGEPLVITAPLLGDMLRTAEYIVRKNPEKFQINAQLLMALKEGRHQPTLGVDEPASESD
jgi:hypothetical protein